MQANASGDIAIAVLRRAGTIATPVYLWFNSAWVDFSSLTALQFSDWVTARSTPVTDADTGLPSLDKQDGVTISRTQY